MPVPRRSLHVVNLQDSEAYRSYVSLRAVNRQLVDANDALRRINAELTEANADLQRENLELHLRLSRSRASRPRQ
jgi:hypothetical protein